MRARMLCAVFALVAFAGSASAQQRPLLTQDPEPIGAGRTLIRAEVPQLEITRYAIDLRSISHGTATFTRAYARHEAMPPQLAQKMQAD